MIISEESFVFPHILDKMIFLITSSLLQPVRSKVTINFRFKGRF